MCSLVKWSVRLNDLSDFGVTDEIDLENCCRTAGLQEGQLMLHPGKQAGSD